MKITVYLVLGFSALARSSLLEMSQTLWARVVEGGFQKIGKLDPLRVPMIKVDQVDNNTRYEIILRNVEVTGLNNSMLESIHIARGKLKSKLTDLEAAYVSYSDLKKLDSIRYKFHTLTKEDRSQNDRVGEKTERFEEVVELESPINEDYDDEKKSQTENRRKGLKIGGVTLEPRHRARLRFPVQITEDSQMDPVDVEVIYARDYQNGQFQKAGKIDYQQTKFPSSTSTQHQNDKIQDEASENIELRKGTSNTDNVPEDESRFRKLFSTVIYERPLEDGKFRVSPELSMYEVKGSSGSEHYGGSGNEGSKRYDSSPEFSKIYVSDESTGMKRFMRVQSSTEIEGSARFFQPTESANTHTFTGSSGVLLRKEPIPESYTEDPYNSHSGNPLDSHEHPGVNTARGYSFAESRVYTQSANNPTEQPRCQEYLSEGRFNDREKKFDSPSKIERLEKQPEYVDIIYVGDKETKSVKHFGNLRMDLNNKTKVYELDDLMEDLRANRRYIVHNFTEGESLYKRNDAIRIGSETRRLKDMIRYAQNFQEKQGYFEVGMQLMYHYGGMEESDNSKYNESRRNKRQHPDTEEEDVMHVILQVRVPLLQVKADYLLMGNSRKQQLQGNGLFIGNFTDVVGDFIIELKAMDKNSMVVRTARVKLVAKERHIQLQGMDENGPVDDILTHGVMAAEAVAAMIADDLTTKLLNEGTTDAMVYKMYSNLPTDVNPNTDYTKSEKLLQ